MLFDVFVIFWPLSDFFAKHDFWGAVVATGFYGMGVVGSIVLPNVFMIWTACRYLPLFWLGFKMCQRGSDLLRRIPAWAYVATDVLLFFLVQWTQGQSGIVFKLLNLGLGFVLNVVGALMAFVVLQNIADKVKWQNKYFAFFSRRSMAVYLLHQQVIYFFIYWLNGLVNPYVNAAVNFVGALTISLLIATVLMKSRTTRFLVGEK